MPKMNGKMRAYFGVVRPAQWVKNLMLIFPPFLGGAIFSPGLISKGITPFISFCLASSSTYVINDIIDREKDLHHPRKRHRAIPSGKMPISAAYILAAVLLAGAFVLGVRINATFLLILICYIIISLAYSLKLKEMPIVDLFCISAGFVLRMQAGGVIFAVKISDWLFLSVFLLSIFLSTGKRLSEKNTMGENAGNHRRSLLAYPTGFLDGTMYMTGGTVLVTYTMYVVSRPLLVYTVPLCAFGLLRYIMRVKSGFGGDPTDSLFRDFPLFITSGLWAFIVCWSIYR